MATQGVALFRQILLLAYFGLSADLDVFSTMFSILSISIIQISSIVENLYIAFLGKIKADSGLKFMESSIFSYFRSSIIIAFLSVGFLSVIFPVLTMLFASGFTDEKKEGLFLLGIYSVPWAILIIPYAALGACCKSLGIFNPVFQADFLIVITSTISIFLFHDSITSVAISFFIGYAVGIFRLLPLISPKGQAVAIFPWKDFCLRAAKHFSSSQVGTTVTLAERFWLSFVPAGGIAAYALVQQMIMSFANILSLRDAYLVPLVNPYEREKKITRLIVALSVISIISAAGVISLSDPICRVLFEHGKVSFNQVNILGDILSVGIVGMVLSVVSTPVWRLLQAMGQYRPLAMLYVAQAVLTVVLGYFFVRVFDLGVIGIAWVSVLNALLATTLAGSYALKFGFAPTSKQAKTFAILFCASVIAAIAVSQTLQIAHENPWIDLCLSAGMYVAVLIPFALVERLSVMSILRG